MSPRAVSSRPRALAPIATMVVVLATGSTVAAGAAGTRCVESHRDRDGTPAARPAVESVTRRSLAATGARLWAQSPDPANPVACATCHHDVEATRGWAASFPKFKPLPPPHARVMTLGQAVTEAVERHYRLVEARPAAVAITAYLIDRGASTPVSPGTVVGQPVFDARMRALGASVRRGRDRFATQCRSCHPIPDLAVVPGGFPRVRAGQVEPLEEFVATHGPARLDWRGVVVADLIAYLTSQRAGHPLGEHARARGGPAPPGTARGEEP